MHRLAALDHALVVRLNRPVARSPRLRWAVSLAAQWLSGAEIACMVWIGLTGRIGAAVRMLLAVGLLYGIVDAAGSRWQRRRPFARLEQVVGLVGHEPHRSFPSRHVASAVAMALIALPARPRVGRLMAAMAAALAASRVLAGLHYPSDVLVGAALGSVVGRLLRR